MKRDCSRFLEVMKEDGGGHIGRRENSVVVWEDEGRVTIILV